MAASAMVGQQMEMMGSRVKAQSRAESLDGAESRAVRDAAACTARTDT